MEDVYATDKYGYRHPMKKIPKFYYKRGKMSGGPYNGNDTWQISEKPAPGYHICPAFMYYGREMPYICIGRAAFSGREYQPQTNISAKPTNNWTNTISPGLYIVDVCKQLAPNHNSRCWTIYDLFVIQLLFLIDKLNPDYQTIYNCTNVWYPSNATDNWRGIYHLTECYQWVDGIRSSSHRFRPNFDNSNWHMYDNQGYFTWVDLGNQSDGRGWNGLPFYGQSGSNWDLSDTFLMNTFGNQNKGPLSCDSSVSSFNGRSGLLLNNGCGGHPNYGLFSMYLHNGLNFIFSGRLVTTNYDH